MGQRLLQNRKDIDELVQLFYSRARKDDLIGPIFNDVARVNWDEHLPKIADFWETLLFGSENYRGRPFPPHLPLGLRAEHFRRWLELFFQSVDDLYQGQKADEIKMRAFNMGRNFLRNLQAMGKID